MNGLTAWVQQLDFSQLLDMAVLAAASLICITFHELCHGLAALALGDPTAKRMGRLSLNPLKHIDPVGLVLMIVARFGWAKPVPIDPSYFKNPKAGMAITALAGPLGNVVLAAAATVIRTVCLYLGWTLDAGWLLTAGDFFYYIILLSVGLAVFNLLPIPPLDGSKILAAVLPEQLYFQLMRYERYGMAVLAVLLMTDILDGALDAMRGALLGLMNPIASWVAQILISLNF